MDDKASIIKVCIEGCIEKAIGNWKRELFLLSKEMKIPYEEIEKQARLHVPLFSPEIINNSDKVKMPLELKDILVKRFDGYLDKYNNYY